MVYFFVSARQTVDFGLIVMELDVQEILLEDVSRKMLNVLLTMKLQDVCAIVKLEYIQTVGYQ